MAEVKVRIEGLDEAAAAFGRVAPAVQSRLTTANRETARGIEATAKSLVPVRSGALRDAITAATDPRTGDATVGVASRPTPAGNPADYGRHQEYGTVHVAPQPFMTPAAERARGDHDSRARRAVQDGCRDAGKV